MVFDARPCEQAPSLTLLLGRCGRRGSGGSRCGSHRSLDILRGGNAGHADPDVLLLHFDLGQVGLVQDVREVADHPLVDTVLILRPGKPYCSVYLVSR